MMTKKDFEALASALRETRASLAICEGIAAVLLRDNPRFNRSLFLDACGRGVQR